MQSILNKILNEFYVIKETPYGVKIYKPDAYKRITENYEKYLQLNQRNYQIAAIATIQDEIKWQKRDLHRAAFLTIKEECIK